MRGKLKATNFKVKNNRGKTEYWLSADSGKTWKMVTKGEFDEGVIECQ